ncbi:hypothetical protein [Rickettsia asembonensis]|uniref:hypothetical protein n=1 Tax=Rickettsia asembonensis TaxID=1068590 RepID=UPI00130ED4C0|nr:hypothetical protein [Rickettsia asembonensis]
MANGLTLHDVERFFRHCEEALPAWIPWSSHGMTAKSAGFLLLAVLLHGSKSLLDVIPA